MTDDDTLERIAAASEAMLAAADSMRVVMERAERREHQRDREESQRRQEAKAPQRPLRRLGVLSYMRAVPGLAAQFSRLVPEEYWSMAAGSDDRVTVTCPCGTETVATYGQPVECDCERFFLFDGLVVRVANSPADQETRAA